MADGYCGVPVQKEFRDWQADYLAAADNDGVLAGNLTSSRFKQLDYAFRSAWDSVIRVRTLLPKGGSV